MPRTLAAVPYDPALKVAFSTGLVAIKAYRNDRRILKKARAVVS